MTKEKACAIHRTAQQQARLWRILAIDWVLPRTHTQAGRWISSLCERHLMDPRHFDTLARSLISSSRREAMLALAVVMFASVVSRDANAKHHGRRGNHHRSGATHDRNRGRTVASEKKHKKKKKKQKQPPPVPTPLPPAIPLPPPLPPPPCSPNCLNKTCGGDGCSGVCGSGTCGTGQSCVNGNCDLDAGLCAPPCSGGKTCQSNGQCICPPDKPHSAPEQYCDDTCRECCIDSHCHPTKHCSHPQGSICVCTGYGHRDCGTGFCTQCCTPEDCIADHGFSNNVICTAPGNPLGGYRCACSEGLTLCEGTPRICANINTDAMNCGSCGHRCPEEFPHCVNRQCQAT
jgi:hypothetical protein